MFYFFLSEKKFHKKNLLHLCATAQLTKDTIDEWLQEREREREGESGRWGERQTDITPHPRACGRQSTGVS